MKEETLTYLLKEVIAELKSIKAILILNYIDPKIQVRWRKQLSKTLNTQS